jgi:putative transposase
VTLALRRLPRKVRRICADFVPKAAGAFRHSRSGSSLDRVPVRERPQEPGGWYSLGVRGVRQLLIAFDDRDHLRFRQLFAITIHRFDWRCAAWCLMPNHVHMLVQIAEANLSNGMFFLNHSYSRYLNRRHGYRGHAFDRRFYSELIETDAHLFEVARYVVLNPVRAGLCQSPEEWTSSSHGAVLGLDSQPFVDTDWLLGHFGRTRERAIENYARFVADRLELRREAVTKS